MRYLMILMLVGGCSLLEPQPEKLSQGAVPMVAPASFAAYWAQIDACSGIVRPMTTSFYKVSAPSLDPYGIVAGLYQPVADRITLSLTALADSNIIRHEMLHAHLRLTEGNVHPSEFFVEKCGGLVSH
jgi:hypothetical protein